MPLKLMRLAAGEYFSKDGRVHIYKRKSQQTGRATTFTWAIEIHGRQLPLDGDTKADAVSLAEQRLQELDQEQR